MPITWSLGDQVEWFNPNKYRGLRRRGQGQQALIKEIHPFNKYSNIQKLTIGLLSSNGTVYQEIAISDDEILLVKEAAEILKAATPTVNFNKLMQGTPHVPQHYLLDNGVNSFGSLLSAVVGTFQQVQKSDTVEFLWASKFGSQIFTAHERCLVEDNVRIGHIQYLIIRTPRGDRVEIQYDPTYMETLLP